MTRQQKEPLRPLTAEERATLERVSRAGSERADRVARARALLAVAAGATYTQAATTAGRRSGAGVARLVRRCHQRGHSYAVWFCWATVVPLLWAGALHEVHVTDVQVAPDRPEGVESP